MKVYSLTVRNRFTAMLLALAVLGAGAALLLVGFALIAGLAIVGGVLGTGFAVYNRLRGTRAPLPRAAGWQSIGLDPALEVFPDQPLAGERLLPPRAEGDG